VRWLRIVNDNILHYSTDSDLRKKFKQYDYHLICSFKRGGVQSFNRIRTEMELPRLDDPFCDPNINVVK
jgi:hypothetical protein